jgi:hypothetical protein
VITWVLHEDYDVIRAETCRMPLVVAGDVHHLGSSSSVVYVTLLISLQSLS